MLKHGYSVFNNTYTICYMRCYITIHRVDRYSNITEDITKPVCHRTLNIPQENIIHIY